MAFADFEETDVLAQSRPPDGTDAWRSNGDFYSGNSVSPPGPSAFFATFAQFFAETLHFSLLPGSPSAQCASFFTCFTKRGALLRVTHRMRGNLVGRKWEIRRCRGDTSLTDYCRAAREFGDSSSEDAAQTRQSGHSPLHGNRCSGTLYKFRGSVPRHTNRARRRFS